MPTEIDGQVRDRYINFLYSRQHDGPFSELADDVRKGLTKDPKSIPSKYFYDERGSRLFEQITQLAEYYPMRAEKEILETYASQIIDSCKPGQLVEFGSGSSTKSRALLDAMQSRQLLISYVPVDISEGIVRRSASELSQEYPEIEITALIGDFEKDLNYLPPSDRRLIAFLGGTIGNFPQEQRVGFLEKICRLMGPEDHLLLGTDLVKPRGQLEAAYNDQNGVTEKFNKNLLAVVNRELGGDFNLDRFEHVAFFNEDLSCIEMRLRSLVDHSVRVGELGQAIFFETGEEIRTEICCKFTRETVESSYKQAGLALCDWYTDSLGRFALSTAKRNS